jgi:hypothetical protein
VRIASDHAAGAAAVAAALVVLAMSGNLPIGTLSLPGAGMMPKLVCGLMILLGVVLIVRGGGDPLAAMSWRDLPHAGRVFVIAAAAAAVYTVLGFIVAMTLMLFLLIACEVWPSPRGLWAAAVFSVGITLFTYLLFTTVLKQPLEQGVLGF